MNLKLTSKDMKTYRDTPWELGEWRQISTEYVNPDAPLCSDSWIHFYHNASPELAIVLNPIHAGFRNPRLFRVETGPQQKHEALKSGATSLRLVEELPVPEVSIPSLVRFAIYVAREVGPHPKDWEIWAQKWLDRSDRSDRSLLAVPCSPKCWCRGCPSRTLDNPIRHVDAAVTKVVVADAAMVAASRADIDFNKLLKKAIKDESDSTKTGLET